MTSELTLDQSRALAERSNGPLRLLDPATNESYVLLSSAEYERLTSIDPRDAYGAIERVFAEGWNDPKLDDYDRYEEFRK